MASMLKRLFSSSGSASLSETLTNKLFSEFGKLGGIGSVYSAFSALVPLFEASRGSTREKLGDLLGLDPRGSYLKQCASLGNMLMTTGELQTNNVIAVHRELPIIPAYFANMKSIGVDTVEFSSPEELVVMCNQYANEKTKGLITELLTEKDVTPDTALVICSTVYFLSKWKKPFISSMTSNRDFIKVNGSKVKLPLMYQYETYFGYHANDKFQYLDMSYQNEDFAMGVILPRDPSDLESVNTIDVFRECAGSVTMKELNVYFPKFTHRSRTSLKEAVTKFGCGDIFEHADLKNLTTRTDTYVSDIIHEAVVIVDEMKTEAAGTTGVVIMLESCRAPRKVENFVADHSFGYVIYHRPTMTVLFNGCFDA